MLYLTRAIRIVLAFLIVVAAAIALCGWGIMLVHFIITDTDRPAMYSTDTRTCESDVTAMRLDCIKDCGLADSRLNLVACERICDGRLDRDLARCDMLDSVAKEKQQ